jgi:hypothetical protein
VVVALGSAAAALESAVDVGEQSDAGSGSEVDLAGEGGDSEVDPVVVEGGEFAAGAGLDVVDPGGAFDEVVLLEVLCEGLNELLGRDVLDSEEGLLALAQHMVINNQLVINLIRITDHHAYPHSYSYSSPPTSTSTTAGTAPV